MLDFSLVVEKGVMPFEHIYQILIVAQIYGRSLTPFSLILTKYSKGIRRVLGQKVTRRPLFLDALIKDCTNRQTER